ncbi:MAG: bifunctional 5,10-methylenetetrahydrofolate dehydrogenase/5,10-methenyltetrahydrofolate cyclohydrolase [Terriglobales bacterium]
MAAVILDGNQIAAQIKAEAAQELQALAADGIHPGMAVVLVGDESASEMYVRNKLRACVELGIYTEKRVLPETINTAALVDVVQALNARDDVDGILVQLPLPAHIDVKLVQLAIDPAKDIDGFHPINVGWLATNRDTLAPCTPAGIVQILKRSGIPIAGAEAVVIGRSDVVGKPTCRLLMQNDATVTVCHSKTRDVAAVCRRGDIVVAAVGRPGFVRREFIKPGATVIDVGINRITDPAEFERLFPGDAPRAQQFAAKGSILAGDVHPEVAKVAGALTPVPGGVGPLTVAMSIVNTLKAARLRRRAGVPGWAEKVTC